MLKKSVFFIMTAVVLTLSVFAGGGKDKMSDSGRKMTVNDPRLFQPGKLTVATGDTVYPPWMMDDNPAGGEGFENALVYALAAELGFQKDDVVWVRQTFDQGIAPGAKPYDFNIQQYSVKEERKEFVDFSIVYYKPEKALVALSDSDISSAKTFADLRLLRWGATIGTTDMEYIENIVGVKDISVYNDQSATFQAMLADQIDATVISLPTALYVTAVQVPQATVAAILPHDPNDLGHGLVFEKGNPIVPWINKGLQALVDKGIVDQLSSQYLIGDDSIPEISE